MYYTIPIASIVAIIIVMHTKKFPSYIYKVGDIFTYNYICLNVQAITVFID